MTIGRLRALLAKYHESDVVVVVDFYGVVAHPKVSKRQTPRGACVVIEQGRLSASGGH